MSRFYTILLAAILTLPAAAALDPVPGTDRASLRPLTGQAFLVWTPVASTEEVRYTVQGRLGVNWTDITDTRGIYAIVPAWYEEYVVIASAGGVDQDVMACVFVRPFPPQGEDHVQTRHPCSVLLVGAGQGI